MTFVPGFQYARGRQSARSRPEWSVTQPHDPSVPLDVVTFNCRSTSAFRFTGRSKTIDSGCPMPTVAFFPGASVSLFTRSAFSVVKADRVVASFPSVPRETTFTVYAAPGTALRSEVQRVPPAADLPVSRPPSAAVTVTDVIVPPAAVTVTCFPASGFTTVTRAGAPPCSAPPEGAAEEPGPLAARAVQAVRQTARATAARAGRDVRIGGTEHLRKRREKGGMPGL
ncbi:hypothetical protein SUDANB25_00049 [Streptomyces sp. SudanB25_2051]